MSKVFEILKRLDDAKVHYFIGRYRTAKDSGWPVCDLALQPWGLRDFRLVDPDGYYVRVTSAN